MKPSNSNSGYQLTTLVLRPEDTIQFSPYVWKTIIGLRYLNIPFTQQHLTFDGIRSDLAKELGDDVIRVPVLRNDQGEWIKESFDIALYLDRTHAVPKGKSLFLHGVGGREFCRFVNYWADTVVLPEIAGPLVRPRVYSALPPDSASAKYFLSSRYGSASSCQSAVQSSSDPSTISSVLGKSRKTLQLAENMLAYQAAHGGKKFLGGDFSHADAALFGVYLFARRFVPECEEGVWGHEELPNVKAWVAAVIGLGVVSQEEVEASS